MCSSKCLSNNSSWHVLRGVEASAPSVLFMGGAEGTGRCAHRGQGRLRVVVSHPFRTKRGKDGARGLCGLGTTRKATADPFDERENSRNGPKRTVESRGIPCLRFETWGTRLSEWDACRHSPDFWMYIWRPGQLPIGQTAKARSGYRVQSLRMGRDRQCKTNPMRAVTTGLVKIERSLYALWI